MLVTSAAPGGVVGDLAGQRTDIGPCGRTRLTFVPASTRLELSYRDFAPPLFALALPHWQTQQLLGPGMSPPRALALQPGERQAHTALRAACIIMRGWEKDGSDLATLIARLIARLGETAVSSQAACRVTISPRRLRLVLAFIEENLASQISVQDLATLANLSPFHFSRAFKQETGQSPHGYVQRRRILRAVGLLGNARLSLAEIAGLTGFSTPAAFSTTFNQWTGQSPSRFRQRLGAALRPVRGG